jgi:hypothetical protein
MRSRKRRVNALEERNRTSDGTLIFKDGSTRSLKISRGNLLPIFLDAMSLVWVTTRPGGSTGTEGETRHEARIDGSFDRAWLVRSCLDDPRRIPLLLVWKDERDGEVKETVRMACRIEEESKEFKDYVELKRTNGSTTILPIVADAATQRRALSLPALSLLQHSAPSCLRLGMGPLRGNTRPEKVMLQSNLMSLISYQVQLVVI